MLSFSRQHSSESKKMMNRYGLCVALCYAFVNWWWCTKVIAMEGGGGVCVDVADYFYCDFGVA